MLATDAETLRDLAEQYGLGVVLLLVAVIVLWRHSTSTNNKLIAALQAGHADARLSAERNTAALAAELAVLRSSMESALGASHSSQLRQEERLGTQAAELVRHDVRLKTVEDSQQDLSRRIFSIESRDRHG